MTPLAAYLNELRATKATRAHTAETSFYPALKNLLDAVGDRLKPKVRCVMNLRNQGAGLPDGGLFTNDQLGRVSEAADPAPLFDAIPSRGAIEVKAASSEIAALARSRQASRYGSRYRHVLLTNLREFWLVEHDDSGHYAVREHYSLAANEAEFWRLATQPVRATETHESRFLEFLERVLRTPAPLASPEDLAWFLASYARDVLIQLEHGPVDALDDVADALGLALGVSFEGNKGRHFFRSTLVQTLFYGVFSAWVLWSGEHRHSDDRFSWREATERLHVPMLRVLFHEVTRPTTFFAQFLKEGLLLAEAALNRVHRTEFFKRFQKRDAVQYFYEPFLEAFDPVLRKQLGVWYTPEEIVRYMVERIDRALREELGISSGFADPSVLVLDPCCGTGAYLVAVLDRIANTLREQGEDATVAAQLVQAAMERIIGFEILPAPFVVAHLQVGVYLQALGARLPADARAAIYLTNALTGWEGPADAQMKLLPEFAAERSAADMVKRRVRVLVVLGNPPYNAFAGVQPAEEQESVELYKQGLTTKWRIRKFNLDDLFVRFFRLAERKIAEQSGRGIACFISNASYAADPSFVVFRERLLHQFDSITIDNLNGDSRETGKLTPDGRPDPSIFSTAQNREGIRVGTAVSLLVLSGSERSQSITKVRWRDFWGITKRADLLASLDNDRGYTPVLPTADNRWSFKPNAGSAAYRAWHKLTEFCAWEPISGLAEKRKGGLMALDREILERRMRVYFDGSQSWEEIETSIDFLAENAADYPARKTRTKLIQAGETYSPEQVRRYAFLPLDNRWCYHTDVQLLWNRARPALASQAWKGNRFFVTRMNAERPGEKHVTLLSSALPDHHLLRPNIVAIPLRLRSVVMGREETTANLSKLARSYLARLDLQEIDASEERASLLWYHCLAITYSPKYLAENGEAMCSDFPRVPLPLDRSVLERSATLGRRLADLLDPDADLPGVTSGKIDPQLRPLGALCRIDGAAIDPSAGDLAIEARWGTLHGQSVVMPGPGRTTDVTHTIAGHPLGAAAIDVWLNNRAYWHAVPRAVWDFTIGGYQVLKKWLSYREKSVLKRDLTLDEARCMTGIVRRIAVIVLMSDQFDDVYQASRERSFSTFLEVKKRRSAGRARQNN